MGARLAGNGRKGNNSWPSARDSASKSPQTRVSARPMPSTPPPQTYRVKSFGCQMNVYDGDRMAELLTEQGMSAAAEGADADLVVLNTCHIREKAAEKVYS